jgi:endonuclease/exonuclease/phosphatase family metal-dependent hydrolase
MTPPLRIVSWNVRYFGHALRGLASTKRPKLGIAAALAALDPAPDIICLQEVETISLRSRIAYRRKHAKESQLESFMDAFEDAHQTAGRDFPYEAFYFRADTYGPRRLPFYTTGLAVLVHCQRLHVAGHNEEEPHDITSRHVALMKDRKQARICAHLRLTCNGKPFHVFNTHLSLPSFLTREFWQQKEKMGHGPNQLHEASTLARFVQAHAGDEPFLVCGDFNSAPTSPVYRYLTGEAGFIGAQENLGLIDIAQQRGFPTAGLARLRMHLDHVFSRGVSWVDMQGTACFGDRKSPFHGLSDHVPLIGRFQV